MLAAGGAEVFQNAPERNVSLLLRAPTDEDEDRCGERRARTAMRQSMVVI
jgi:hypothetical protein